jgi:hypothetical protein
MMNIMLASFVMLRLRFAVTVGVVPGLELEGILGRVRLPLRAQGFLVVVMGVQGGEDMGV